MLTLRFRLAGTVLLASIACAILGATLIGALIIHQQRRFELLRITEAYAVATSDLRIGNSISFSQSVPELAPTMIRAVEDLCHATGVGIALLPSYETTNPAAIRTNFSADGTEVPYSIGPTRFQIGPQNSFQISKLASNTQLTQLCGLPIKTAQVAYIEPLTGTGHSSADLLLLGTKTSWLTLLGDVGLGSILLFLGILTIAGVAVKIVLKQLRAATLGYSPVQLAGILEKQEALLQGIPEGVTGCDPSGKIRFFNAEAKRILNLPNQSIGRPLRVLVRGARLRQVVDGEIPGRDLPVVVGESVVIVNHIKVKRLGEDLGYVVTLRDQTEWESLLKELDSLVGMTDALRAQAHEFSNKLHTIIGLIEIGQYAEAVAVATEISLAHSSISRRVSESIGNPMISAMLLAKAAAASERAVDLVIDDESCVHGKIVSPAEILSVIGNLIDNAIDAASSQVIQLGWETSERGWVRILVRDVDGDLLIEVSDSGPGISNDVLPDIFTDGFSTKESRYGARRGLGLALVNQVISRSRGTIEVKSDPGAHFSILIPGAVLYLEESSREAVPPQDKCRQWSDATSLK